MSRVRDLPQTTTLADDDLLYTVDFSAGPNGGRKITKADFKAAVAPTAAETKTAYESNLDTNAFTDAEKTKLASVFAGAKFQQASEVPFDNTGTGLSATEVQDAITQVNTRAQADFIPAIVANRILSYSGGTARFDGIFYQILPSDILLTANVTNGYVYVDLDGTVKQTGTGVLPPPYTIVFAKFTTDSNNIIALEDQRVKNAQNIIRGLVTDIEDVNAGDTAYEGDTGRIADAGHRHAVITGTPSTQTPDQTNTEGSSTSLARADHIHDIPTDIAVDIATANAQGVSTKFARSDHTHRGLHSINANTGSQRFGDTSLVNGKGVTVTDDGSGNFTIDTNLGPNELVVTQGAGLVVNYTAGRVRINGTTYSIAASSLSVTPSATNGRIYVDVDGVVKSTTATSTPANAVPLAIYSSSVSAITALSDNRTLLNVNIQFGASGDIASLTPDLSASAGATKKYADAGHIHNVPTAAAVGLNANSTSTQGAAATFARSDHTHAIASGTPSTQTPDQANAAGSSTNFAKADHIHQLVTAAPLTTLSPAIANAQGSATSFARSDHTHAIATALVGDITTIQPDDSASAGTANTFARGDHKHAIVADPAVSISTSTTNTEGAATSFARSNHTHAVSITNSSATATADDTTTSATDVLIVGMTLTPAAGTYFVTFSSSVLNSANGASRLFVSIYSAGSQVADSERNIGIAGAANVPVQTQAVVTVNGSQAIEARWRAVAGTNTAHQRSLIILKVA